jgi:hypothetical protein
VELVHVNDERAVVSVPRTPRKTPTTGLGHPQPTWDEVLYRGAAATATGEHLTGGTGSFRILASSASPTIEAGNETAVRELTFRGTPETFPGAGEYADR